MPVDLREGVPSASAAISIQKTEHGWHCGLIHARTAEPPWHLHLAFHHQLRNDLADNLRWVQPEVPQLRLKHVAALCRQLWKKRRVGDFPYGFRFEHTAFDPATNELLFGGTEHGLTCATFVLALFRRVGVELLALTTWSVDRPGDAEWRDDILALLDVRDAKQAAAVRSEPRCARFRPAEVAASTALPPFPATFDRVEPEGAALETQLT